MLEIDCRKCDGRCCTSRKRKLFVILTPKEENKFKNFSFKINAGYYALSLKKRQARKLYFL